MVLQGLSEGGKLDNFSYSCLCDRPMAHAHHNQMQTLESFGGVGAQMFLAATQAWNKLIHHQEEILNWIEPKIP